MVLRSLIFILTALVVANVYASPLTCRSLVQTMSVTDLIPGSLIKFREAELKTFSRSEIKAKNNELLRRLQSYVPPVKKGRAQSISLAEAQNLLNYVDSHEVVGFDAKANYKRENVEIGYCFGRAAFLHLLLLKMGLQKESILKVWTVGPQKSTSGEFNWSFHVSTLAYVKGYGWMTLDTSVHKPQVIEHWFSHHRDLSLDEKMRFYVTDPSRFTVDLDKYHPVQMGLKLDRESDWYRHYFKDMVASIAGKNLEELNLSPIAAVEPVAQPNQSVPGVRALLSDFFGF